MNSHKHDEGKSPVMQGCLQYFPRALKAVADISGFGFQKYGSWGGWREVDNGLNRYTDGLGRHLLAEQIEGPRDSESNLLHAAHAAWNALARLELMLMEEKKSPLVEIKEGRGRVDECYRPETATPGICVPPSPADDPTGYF